MNRVKRIGVIAAFAAAIAVCGVASAQDNPMGGGDSGGAGASGDSGGAGGATGTGTAVGVGSPAPAPANTAMAGTATGLYPMEVVARPLQLPKGTVEAGATIAFPEGLDTTGFKFGSWIGFDLRGDYGITDKIQAGLRIPLLLAKPDLTGGLGPSPSFFGGILIDGMYSINQMLSVHAQLGDVRAGGIPLNSAVYPIYNIADLKFGFTAGVAVKKRFLAGKLAVLGDPAFELQADSAADNNGTKAFLGLRIPVAALYQLMPALAAGIRTGIWTGSDFSFSADDGATIPAFLEGQYTLMNGNLDLGADLGFASLLTSSANGATGGGGNGYDSVSHSFYFGVFGAWRMAGLQ